MRFTLDTNVLVYAIDTNAGDRHTIALDIVGRARGRDCVLTLQSLAELFRVLTGQRLNVPAATAADIVQQWRDTMPVVAADEDCLTDAIDAVTHHSWSFWDAMIWATAKKHGCRLLVSEDCQPGRTLGAVTMINPFIGGKNPQLEAALSPQHGGSIFE
jgi:predicted nucleic acid-binding protein